MEFVEDYFSNSSFSKHLKIIFTNSIDYVDFIEFNSEKLNCKQWSLSDISCNPILE